MPKSSRERSFIGSDSKNATFALIVSCGFTGMRLIARCVGARSGFTGHASTHRPQPVQSSPYTCSVYAPSGTPAAFSGAHWKDSGASARALFE